jgi:alkylhydroperoxidase family enzyme
VRTGGARAGGDVVKAREAGISDAAIVDLLAVVASKQFTNAIAIVAQVEVDFPKVPRPPAD